MEIVGRMASAYPFVIVEDPLCEDDFEGFATLTRRMDIQITGDELYATSAKRLKQGISMGAGNAVLAACGHVGTVSEMLDVAQTPGIAASA